MKKEINISIIDCNHGYYDPEIQEAEKLSLNDLTINLNIHNFDEYSKKNDVINKCLDSDVIVVQRFLVDDSLLSQLPRCKVVARYGVGLDNIQISDYLRAAIDVVNFPKFCTEEVADHATALIMFLYRRLDILFSCDNLNNHWGKPDLIDGLCSANNTTIGIVGIGNIGSSVAKRLLSYGFNVIAYDPYVDCFEGVKMVSMDHVFSNSDVLSIHCPLNEETEGMVDLKNMIKMSRGASIVNTSRGMVMNQLDLEKALKENIIRAACIDVCDPEPPNKSSYKIKNLYITPHVAFYSRESLCSLKSGVISESVSRFNDM